MGWKRRFRKKQIWVTESQSKSKPVKPHTPHTIEYISMLFGTSIPTFVVSFLYCTFGRDRSAAKRCRCLQVFNVYKVWRQPTQNNAFTQFNVPYAIIDLLTLFYSLYSLCLIFFLLLSRMFVAVLQFFLLLSFCFFWICFAFFLVVFVDGINVTIIVWFLEFVYVLHFSYDAVHIKELSTVWGTHTVMEGQQHISCGLFTNSDLNNPLVW